MFGLRLKLRLQSHSRFPLEFAVTKSRDLLAAFGSIFLG
jgi:hypothetical protein